jgi:hypothetical protein
VLLDRLADGVHNAGVDLQQVVTTHPRFARGAGGHDDAVRARNVLYLGRSDYAYVDAEDRRRLQHVERLPLRQAVDNVVEDDIAEAAQKAQMGTGGADITGADERDFFSHCHGFNPKITANRRRLSATYIFAVASSANLAQILIASPVI